MSKKKSSSNMQNVRFSRKFEKNQRIVDRVSCFLLRIYCSCDASVIVLNCQRQEISINVSCYSEICFAFERRLLNLLRFVEYIV